MTDWPRARADEIDEEVRSLIHLMMQGEATSEGIARMHRLMDERTKNIMRPRYARRPVTSLFTALAPEQQAAALAYDGPEDFGDPAHLVPHQPAPDDTQLS